jgi:phosphogluconate dehydratase
VNQFHAAGGMGFLVRELIAAGLAHGDVSTVAGDGLARYGEEPWLKDGQLAWRPAPTQSGDRDVLRPVSDPFDAEGGIRLLTGNLGRSVMKISAVKPSHRSVTAPAVVFNDQDEVLAAFKAGTLHRDVVVVLRQQGPRANGMPELHKLTPALGVLQDLGFKVALVTDGRMSGASGKVPAAIHLTPEAVSGGAIARLKDGDMIRLDGEAGVLEAQVENLMARTPAAFDPDRNGFGMGRELFAASRANACSAEEGAVTFAPFMAA